MVIIPGTGFTTLLFLYSFSNKGISIYNVDKLIKHINTMGPSGMLFHKIDHLKIQYSKGNKTRAGSYIPTPTIIKNKNGVVTIRNKTDA